jgi:uncharacterized protein (DUF362 family)/NAD-dependent dihydropyrimidine dehydrogenase PreA subunit
MVLNVESNMEDIKRRINKIIVELFPEGFIQNGETVLIKPNFVSSHKGATTNIDVLKCIIDVVKENGGIPIVGESSGYEFDTDKTFKILEFNKKLEKEYDVKIINFDNEEFKKVKIGHTTLKIPQIVLECDKLINVPKLKMHSVTTVSFGLKNLMGVVHRDTRRKIHILGLSKGIVKINQKILSYLTIVDGLNFMSEKAVFGKEIESNYLIAGRDIVAVDEVCSKLIGIDSNKIKHIRIAKSQLKHDEEIEVIGDYSENNFSELEHQNKFKKTIHNILFWGLYVGDFIYSRFIRDKSILPFFHWYFGIRPEIDKDKCTKCGKCIEMCPVNAIIIDEDIKIERKKCQEVRCFKCMDVCPEEAIKIK